ncbi:MAG: hypothetical protein WCG63_00805 [Opitutaceae bacterium]
MGTFLGHQATHPALSRVPVISKKIIMAKDLRSWNERYQPDVLIGHKDTIVPWLNTPRLGKTPVQGFLISIGTSGAFPAPASITTRTCWGR